MDTQSSSAIECRAARVLLLRELLACFQNTQRSIVLADVKGMEASLAEQHKLCLQLIAMGGAGQEQISPDASAATRMRWSTLTQDLQELERRAQHLGKVQEALLRRSHRAQELMSRLLATTAITYSPPVISQAAGAGK
jgi:type II secretory pathway component PulL